MFLQETPEIGRCLSESYRSSSKITIVVLVEAILRKRPNVNLSIL